VLDRKSQTVVIAGVARMPDLIVLDPDHTLLCRMKPKLSLKLLQRLAKEAPTHPRRMDALKVLSTKSTPKAVASLIEALQSDPFWGVRKRVAGLLASVGTETARNALIAAVSAEANPRARRAIVDALGRFSGDELAYQAVFAIADSGDPSWFAEAAALESVGKLGLDGAAALLESRLDVVSFNDVIAASAISGLASLRTAGALATIGERTSARYTTHVRVAAVLAIGRLGASVPNLRPEVARVLESLLSETELRIRISLVHALRHGRLAEGRTLLGRIIARSDGRVHRLAREASLALAAGVDAEASAALRGDLEILRAEQGRLRTRLGLLE
ncbi:MAG: aminopeptidase N, partial [Myxococcota bacterium]